MSSVIGHSLAALSIYTIAEQPGSRSAKLAWVGWLLVLASLPDCDYLIPALRLEQGGRVTHSLAGGLVRNLVIELGVLVPLALAGWLIRWRRARRWWLIAGLLLISAAWMYGAAMLERPALLDTQGWGSRSRVTMNLIRATKVGGGGP